MHHASLSLIRLSSLSLLSLSTRDNAAQPMGSSAARLLAVAMLASAAAPAAPAWCGFTDGARVYDLSAFARAPLAFQTATLNPWTYFVGICGDVDPFTAGRACGRGPPARAMQVTAYQKLCYRLGAASEHVAFAALPGGALGVAFNISGGDDGRSSRVFLRCAVVGIATHGVEEAAEGGRPVYQITAAGPEFCPTSCAVNAAAATVCGGHGVCEPRINCAVCVCEAGFRGPICELAGVSMHGAPAPFTAATAPTYALVIVAIICTVTIAGLCRSWVHERRSRRVFFFVLAAAIVAAAALAPTGLSGVLTAQLDLRPPLGVIADSVSGSSGGGALSAEDAAYAARLEAIVAASPDPWAIAVGAWRASRSWPVSYARSERFFVAAPRSLAEALEPAALAALNASKTEAVSPIMPRCLEGEECAFGSGHVGKVGAGAYSFKVGEQRAFDAAYARAWRAYTWPKAGIDANRHLEIVSNGVLPVFRGIRAVPPTVLFAYPKKLLGFIEDERGDTDVRHMAMQRAALLAWAHRHMTSRAMVTYMVRAATFAAASAGVSANVSGTPRVAFIDKWLLPFVRTDYLTLLTLIGLVEVFGAENVDVFYPIDYIYEGFEIPDTPQWNGFLYGNGFGYVHAVPPPPPAVRETTFETKLGRLRRGEYAYAVWGAFAASSEHFNDPDVVASYRDAPHRLWTLIGFDSPTDGEKYVAGPAGAPWPGPLRAHSTVFVREHFPVAL